MYEFRNERYDCFLVSWRESFGDLVNADTDLQSLDSAEEAVLMVTALFTAKCKLWPKNGIHVYGSFKAFGLLDALYNNLLAETKC